MLRTNTQAVNKIKAMLERAQEDIDKKEKVGGMDKKAEKELNKKKMEKTKLDDEVRAQQEE